MTTKVPSDVYNLIVEFLGHQQNFKFINVELQNQCKDILIIYII